MASSNNIVVTLTARDQVSSVVNSITSRLDNGLSGALGRATLGANLMTSAITAGLNSLSYLIDSINTKLNESITIQQQNITTAGTLLQMTSLDFEEAGQFIDEFSDKMAKIAAVLPGSTSEYVELGKGIMDNLIPAFRGLNGELDVKGFREALEVITQGAGFLGATNEVDKALTSLGISKFLGGASLSELQNLKFFEANPSLLTRIEEEANKLGKGLKEITAKERVELLKKVLELPDEVIKASSDSISGLVEGLRSSLIDPQTGLFGLMRKLDSNDSTVLKTINRFLMEILGPEGLISNLGETFKVLGLRFKDPMKSLNEVIVNITGKVSELNNIFERFNINKSFSWLRSQLYSFLERVINVRGLGKFASEVINNVIRFLADVVDWNAVFSGIGRVVADLINSIFDYVGNFDYAAIGRLLIRLVQGVITGVIKFFTSIDYIGAFGNIVKGIFNLITAPVFAVMQVLTQDFITFFRDIIDIFLAPIREFFNGVGNLIRGVWSTVVSAIDTLMTWVNNTINFLIDKYNSLFGKPSSQSNSNPSEPSTNKSSKNNVNPTSPPNAFSGLNYEGLLKAANKELKNSPPGSELVVANSSEAILNKDQQSRILSALNKSPVNAITNSRPILNISNITINTQATDARGIAESLYRELELYMQNNVVSPVS